MRNERPDNLNRNTLLTGALREDRGCVSFDPYDTTGALREDRGCGSFDPYDTAGALREDFCFFSLDLQKTGEKLHCFLSRSGYTVRELSHMIGVSNQTIYKWFHGDALPSLNNLYQLSRLFGCSMDELVAGGGVCRYDIPDLYMRESAVT